MWTFFWYSIFQLITLIKVKLRYKIGTASIVLVTGYLIIITIILCTELVEKQTRIIGLSVCGALGLSTMAGIAVLIKSLIKEYGKELVSRVKIPGRKVKE
jgi:hypothetical protein